MDRDTEKYYELYFDLFNSPGWKQFMEDLKGTEEAALYMCATEDDPDVFRAQGELAVVRRLLNFERLQKEAYDQLKEAELEEKELEAEVNATVRI